ncbi:hypothetical protein K9K77_02315 [Candidatus Babeliales bacterium]|nr:hypothetical protein [Candidatus Babeliales bacterium]
MKNFFFLFLLFSSFLSSAERSITNSSFSCCSPDSSYCPLSRPDSLCCPLDGCCQENKLKIGNSDSIPGKYFPNTNYMAHEYKSILEIIFCCPSEGNNLADSKYRKLESQTHLSEHGGNFCCYLTCCFPCIASITASATVRCIVGSVLCCLGESSYNTCAYPINACRGSLERK